ncbi:hypothetical protein HY489_06140 [Candidatus Woesearchaeota archaeon]|nr:hypothetical protein [Candidatus Woesearchaeota archaeon]
MNIIPGVLATTLKELKQQLNTLSWAKKIHLDIMDGKFVDNKTIGLQTLKKHFPEQEVQVHLMAYHPEKYVIPFSKLGAKELIIHAEASAHAPETLEDIRITGMKSGIAFNPETAVKRHKDSLVHADSVLVMTVRPGHSGAAFTKQPLKKIKEIRSHNPTITIGVDGGIRTNTCAIAARARANFAIATSAIQEAEKPKQAYKRLLALSK